MLRRLLLWLVDISGNLTGLASGTKWPSASKSRLVRIRGSGRTRRRRWRRGRLSAPGIDRWNIVRRQSQGAGRY